MAMALTFLLLLLACSVAVHGAVVCPECGKLPVPYPLSTSSSCGHPLYPVTCTAQKTLEVGALSGNYTVESVDPSTRTMVVRTGQFLGNSCVTEDSVFAGNFSLFPGRSFFIASNNTVMLLNASSLLVYTPLKCKDQSPCARALTVIPQKSCRGSLCCSFITDEAFFRYGFPVFGQETGYISVVDLDNSLNPSKWRYGLKLAWEIPKEPPCLSPAQCGANSTCTPNIITPGQSCLCNHGLLWNPSTGTCPKAPYCVRKSGSVECHKTEYAAGSTGHP